MSDNGTSVQPAEVKVVHGDQPDPAVERIRRERDLYLSLLQLSHEQELVPLIESALQLIVEATGAKQGYLEVRAASGAKWFIAHGCSDEDVEQIRAVMSHGILAEALATGEVIQTPSALLDARFADRPSVRKNQIEAVICAPIGEANPTGVLYLQGESGAGPFSTEDMSLVEEFAVHLEPVVHGLLGAAGDGAGDPTAPWRERLKLDGLVGGSETLAAVFQHVALVAPLDVTVLIGGDTGTGKTELARAIHDNSPRSAAPFMAVNCAALPDALIENELFGALAGAHSTATQDRPGKVGAAEGGTLFLDEIGELPASSQGLLLQLLQSKEYFPLGASKPVKADVRIVTATNVDLETRIGERLFRQDLYYRLSVFPIRMPSLSERLDDVALLADHFRRTLSRRHGLRQLRLSPGATRTLRNSEWPGNVRQLAHVLEAGLIRAAATGSAEIAPTHLFPEPGRTPGGAEPAEQTFQAATRRFQGELLRRTLDETEWNVAEAARRLDIARSHIYNLIREHGLTRDGS
ncbi:sigma 54-interacting transcriptional regulator [Planctomycetota bacterium]|nr:sigma 54-interacting transcriptional regulator [Planctomycetota bacterium]